MFHVRGQGQCLHAVFVLKLSLSLSLSLLFVCVVVTVTMVSSCVRDAVTVAVVFL